MIVISPLLENLQGKNFEKLVAYYLRLLANQPTQSNGLGFRIGGFDTSTLTLLPVPNGNLGTEYNIGINGVNFQPANTPISLNLSVSGLGGLIDGIAPEFGRLYLYWAFSDSTNSTLTGFGMSRKPYSGYTSISAPGTAARGTTRNLGGVTNAYQFTIGAKVRIRTDNNPNVYGIAEWNWGTLTTIVNNSTVTIAFDNNVNYGTDITGIGATLNEIEQMNNFQPYIVSPTSQVLFANNFRLLGEVYTDSGTGDISQAYKVDDEFRSTAQNGGVLSWEATATFDSIISLANKIPLWATQANIVATQSGLALDNTYAASIDTNLFYGQAIIDNNAVGIAADGMGYVNVDQFARIYANSAIAAVGIGRIIVNGYRVPGGMQL